MHTEIPTFRTFKRKATLRIEDSRGTLLRNYDGVVVGVETDTETVSENPIYPVFKRLKTSYGNNLRRPAYDRRVAKAEKKARKLARNLENKP